MSLIGNTKSSTSAQDNSQQVAGQGVAVSLSGNNSTLNMTAPEAFKLAETAVNAVRTTANDVVGQLASDAKTAVDALAASRQATIPLNIVIAVVAIAGLYFWSKG